MNDELHQHGPRIPDELSRRWQNQSPDERAELETTWRLAGTARRIDPEDTGLDEVTERLLSALDATDEVSPDTRHHVSRQLGERYAASGRTRRLAAGLALFVAACVVAFLLLNRGGPPSPQFMLLLHGDTSHAYSPDEQAAVIAEYVAWGQELRETNRYVAGDELAAAGRLLARENGRTTERAFASDTEAVAGYFIITAADYDEASRIAAECPHLNYGGTVEIRRILER